MSDLPLTLAVFAGVFMAWRWDSGLGPADGKIARGWLVSRRPH